MRRPSFCCDQHGGDHTKCQPQDGGESTLARVRRFLALSMGGRSAPRCKHQNALPPDPIHSPALAVHSLLADMKSAGVGVQGVLGRPLEEVMAEHGEDSSGHGVPTLVHLLCCFLLTHGVDYDSLVSEDWCAEEVRTRLLLERGAAGVEPDTQQVPPGSDSAVATGLLRLFLDELPHPLLPSDVAPLLLQLADDSGVGENNGESSGGGVGIGGGGGAPGLSVAVVPRLRRLLHRRLPLHHLCLLRYLAAFIHQLRTGNHNTCPVPVDSLSRVLARILTERESPAPQKASANRLGELLILCYTDIFQAVGEVVQEPDDFSDSVSSPDSAGDSREEGLDDADDDDADTTTTDTDDFRSPPVSPLKGERPWGSSGIRAPSSLVLHPPALSSRSTKEIVANLDSFRPEAPTYTKSPESSCVSAQDNWETGGESDGRAIYAPEVDTHEERRFSERFFPRNFPPPSRRNRRRTKKRHHVHSPQDSGSQSQSAEEEKSSSCFSSLTSDDEPTRYDPIPTDVMPCTMGLRAAIHSPSSGLSELVDASEPVTSDRGSWGMRDASVCDSWHRTAPRYSRFDDDSSVQNNWYRDEDDVMVSPRSSQAFVDTRPPPGQDDHSPPPGQGAVKILMKNINTIKKKIKRYEEEFEAAAGYRPSHSEKMKHKEIKKYMSELSKARKELKQMKDDVAGLVSVPNVYPLSLLRCQESTNPGAKSTSTGSGTADTLRQVEDRLRDKRSAVGRPMELKSMNSTEMQDEKTALQKALLYYESLHGRPTTREDRDLARPLYDRYRQVKRIVMRARTKENMVELPPIIEHVAMDFTLASPQHRSSLQGDEGEKLILAPSNTPVTDNAPNTNFTQIDTPSNDPKEGQRSLALGDLHALPISELRERKKEAREEKKKLRRTLRDYEEKFEREMGRKVQKEDRGPMEQTYLDYKHAKAKLRLLEALLSKHEPHKI
ncbi:protein FAM13C-like isoform X8 [Portunus trituberculatus]|uniref:protein FAM13C-like isoform X8 n=1 Tax=Portunus trituberculatus TaxID=210409 RepID=UPI001E1D008C|nr:protein FAM13C-like isoform X8 [Portunus trituberculatus]XP_045101856.1 protein FAM13C-like isoform X8 [Portunus trituberculatus]